MHAPATPDARPRPPFHEIESAIWADLVSAVNDKAHPWRVMALATVDAAGEPQARHVVLREVQTALGQLVFYTDRRSPKVAQIQHHDRGSLLMWNAQRGWQLRLTVRLEIIDSGLDVSARWARLAMSPAAQDYLSPLPPGTPVSPGPYAAELTPVPPHPTASLPHEAARRGHFAVVKAHVQAIDWLELHPQGHRRALWQDRQWEWVVP